VVFLEKPLQKVEFAEIPRFKRCSTGPSRAVSVTLVPLDFGEKGVYASYTPDRKLYSEAEIEARKAKRGLWRDPNPVPPWEWRRGTR
jgi:endonuclease YncB( thermonuclease family)